MCIAGTACLVILCRRLSKVWSSSRGERCVSQRPSIPLSSSVPSLVIESSVVVSNVSHSVQVFLCRRLSQVWSSSRGEQCVSQHPSIPLSSSVPSLVIESSVVVSNVPHSVHVFLCRRLSLSVRVAQSLQSPAKLSVLRSSSRWGSSLSGLSQCQGLFSSQWV